MGIKIPSVGVREKIKKGLDDKRPLK
jgi:hypothetical protein